MKRIHGESHRTKEYVAWENLKARCLCPTHFKYPDYGGRGITVCADWVDDYAAFLAHVGRAPSKRHSLGRIKNELGYQPGNVRWETPKQQQNNLRTNVLVEYEMPLGVMTLTLSELAQMTGVCRQLLRRRIADGWSVAAAVNPAHEHNNTRKVTCPKCAGEFTKRADGTRYCRRCNAQYKADWKRRKRQQ